MTPGAPASTQGSPGAPGARRHARLSAVLLLLVALLVIPRWLVAEPFRIVSSSMTPTLSSGDSVLVDKRTRTPSRRGQMVALRDPKSSEILVKRAVGLAGDLVGIEDGRLVVNGRPADEPFVDREAVDSVYFGPLRVPPGTVFVLGDNRANSVDSRSFGPVATSALIGRVRARIWPPARWGSPG